MLLYSTSHKFFCIGFCLAFSVCLSRFRGLPQDMVISSRCLRRNFPKKVKSIFSYGIARPLENKLRMNFDPLPEFRETPDYHKNCSPSCTSDSYSYAFCRLKLILLMVTRAIRRSLLAKRVARRRYEYSYSIATVVADAGAT